MVKKATDGAGRNRSPAVSHFPEPKRLPPCPHCGGELFWFLIVTGPHRGHDDVVCNDCGWELPHAPAAEGGGQ